MRCFIILFSLCLLSVVSAAELSEDDRQAARAIDQQIRRAGSLYAAGDYSAAADEIRAVIGTLGRVQPTASAALNESLSSAWQRIEKAHLMLELEGVTLPPLPSRSSGTKPMVSAAATKVRSRPRRGTPKPGPSPAAGAIRFSKQVAPILVARCGRCHVSDSKGRFSMANFASLMKGPPEGVVIFAGDTVGSRLIETIETGDMPRGGGRVSPEELQTLKTWITSGAKFDGDDPTAPLVSLGAPLPNGVPPSANATGTAPMPLATRRSTGQETVSFAGDVAPLLVQHCRGCHVDAMQNRGGLRMDTFAQLLRGGDSGSIINPGSGSDSLLIRKLRGTEGQRMPAGGRPPLSEDAIGLIATWIDEGATLDGLSDTQPLTVMSQLAWASQADSGQISKRRQELAQQHMTLVTASSEEVHSQVTEHFFVIGPMPDGVIASVAKLAEAQISTVKKTVSAKSGEGLFRGRATLFVLPKRYDYSEFAKMVEARDLPADWSSHWKFDGIDAYVALVAGDQADSDEIARRLTAPLVSLAMSTRAGDVPRWLAEGVGRVTANRNAGSRDREAIRSQEVEIYQAVAAIKDAKQFLDGKMTPVQTDRVGQAIAATLLDRTRRRNFSAMLRNLEAGKPFEIAFRDAFRIELEPFVESWRRWAQGGSQKG